MYQIFITLYRINDLTEYSLMLNLKLNWVMHEYNPGGFKFDVFFILLLVI